MQRKPPSRSAEAVALDALADQFDRQNALLEETFEPLRALGDVPLIVPAAFLEELEDTCRPAAPIARLEPTMNFVRC